MHNMRDMAIQTLALCPIQRLHHIHNYICKYNSSTRSSGFCPCFKSFYLHDFFVVRDALNNAVHMYHYVARGSRTDYQKKSTLHVLSQARALFATSM